MSFFFDFVVFSFESVELGICLLVSSSSDEKLSIYVFIRQKCVIFLLGFEDLSLTLSLNFVGIPVRMEMIYRVCIKVETVSRFPRGFS